jgi:hypothetical protein
VRSRGYLVVGYSIGQEGMTSSISSISRIVSLRATRTVAYGMTFHSDRQQSAEAKSQELRELVHAQSSIPDNTPLGPSIKLLVVGDHYLGEWIISSENDVAPPLPFDMEASSLEGLDALPAGYYG